MTEWTEKTNTQVKKKATFYRPSEFGMGYVKTELWLKEVGFMKYAQYNNAPYVVGTPKRKRTAYRWIKGYDPKMIVLEGWGHPDPPSGFTNPVVDPVTGWDVKRSKHLCFDEAYDVEFDEELDSYLRENAVQVLFDTRKAA